LELGHILEKSGHLCGKKHELQIDFPHCDLIVLEYNDVQDGSSYKHLDARQEKEKTTSNHNNTRKGVNFNTVVLHLLLYCTIYAPQPNLIGMFAEVLMVPPRNSFQ
jgi:hypothetical protein